MEKKIYIRIFPDGKISAETIGIKGKECTKYIKIIEDLLSAESYESSYTNEYYENAYNYTNLYNEQIIKEGKK